VTSAAFRNRIVTSSLEGIAPYRNSRIKNGLIEEGWDAENRLVILRKLCGEYVDNTGRHLRSMIRVFASLRVTTLESSIPRRKTNESCYRRFWANVSGSMHAS
jgi:hypothetical protein